MSINIFNKTIRNGSDPLIIAEIGINHNGSLDTAFEMIQIAKDASVDVVKFQTFQAEEFVGDKNQKFTYFSQGNQVTESMYEMFKRYEFKKEDWKKIKNECDRVGIHFLSTPQNYSDLEILLDLNIEAIKVGSDDFINIPLIKKFAKTNLPLILSIGMADIIEIYQTLESINYLDGYPIILLLCTSQYPTPPEDVNLNKFITLKNNFPNIPIGFSDHTQGSLASSVAVGFGACVFEKHFTLDQNFEGPDHWFSEDPKGLKVWAENIRSASKMLGSTIIKPTKKEINMRKLARRSIIAVEDIPLNQIFTENNVGLRRPGTGLDPLMLNKIVGCRSSRYIKKGSQILLGDFVYES